MEAQRKTLRLALMGRCIDEGLTNKDIARIWGVSVQLVSRYTAPEHMPG
jgi:predicted transcriptional regulator